MGPRPSNLIAAAVKIIMGIRNTNATDAIEISMARLAKRSVALKGARWISIDTMRCPPDEA